MTKKNKTNKSHNDTLLTKYLKVLQKDFDSLRTDNFEELQNYFLCTFVEKIR